MGPGLSRPTLTRLVLLGSLAASACSFVLDFDKLQKGDRLPGSGGALATAGEGSAGESSASGGVAVSSGGSTANASGGEPSAQAGAGADSGGGGAAGESSNEQAGSAGAPLSSGCSPACVDLDDDPCTTVNCIDAGHGPECVSTPLTGLVLETDLPPIATTDPHQIALSTSKDEFLLSLWSQTEQGSKDAAIYRLAQTPGAMPHEPAWTR
jgi:hypothetical protein